MTGQELLAKGREVTAIYRKGMELLWKAQSGLNDDLENGRIPYGEWKEKTEENERKKALFKEQYDSFWREFESLKKY